LVDPAEVGLLGVVGVVEEAELVADLIVELHGGPRYRDKRTPAWGPPARLGAGGGNGAYASGRRG
jgi:hypothetical protein